MKKNIDRSQWVGQGLTKGQAEALLEKLKSAVEFRGLAVEVRTISYPTWYGIYCTAARSDAAVERVKTFCEAAQWAWGGHVGLTVQDTDEKHMAAYRSAHKDADLTFFRGCGLADCITCKDKYRPEPAPAEVPSGHAAEECEVCWPADPTRPDQTPAGRCSLVVA